MNTKCKVFRCVIIALFVLQGGSVALAQSAVGDKLATLRASYEKAQEGINDSYSTKARGVHGSYLKELQKRQAAAQKTGDLEKVVVYKTEQDRFKSTRSMPDDPDSASSALAALQKRCSEMLSACERTMHKQTVALYNKYAAGLNSQMKAYTKSGKFEEAVKVKEELESIKLIPEVTEAKFALVASGDVEESASTGKEEEKPDQKARKTDDGMIYAPGERAPMPKNARYKRMALQSSKLVPMSKDQISVVVSSCSATTSSDRNDYYYYETTKSSEKQTRVRVSFRTKNSKIKLNDVTAVIELFSRSTGGSSKVSASSLGTRIIELDSLDTRLVYVDLKPASTSKSVTKSDGYYYSSRRGSTTKEGNEFYGVTVNIFNADGELMHSTASTKTLIEFVLTKKP